jgi:hypothetical protein
MSAYSDECTHHCLNTCCHYDDREQFGVMSAPGADTVSFYIPRIHKNFDESQVSRAFESRGIGKVRRVDFVPLNPVEPGERETEFSIASCYQKAFVHFDHLFDSPIATEIFQTVVQKDGSFRLFHEENKYWILLNNKMVVPDTALNSHQMAENHRVLTQTVMQQAGQIEKLDEVVNIQAAQITRLLELVMNIERQILVMNIEKQMS